MNKKCTCGSKAVSSFCEKILTSLSKPVLPVSKPREDASYKRRPGGAFNLILLPVAEPEMGVGSVQTWATGEMEVTVNHTVDLLHHTFVTFVAVGQWHSDCVLIILCEERLIIVEGTVYLKCVTCIL